MFWGLGMARRYDEIDVLFVSLRRMAVSSVANALKRRRKVPGTPHLRHRTRTIGQYTPSLHMSFVRWFPPLAASRYVQCAWLGVWGVRVGGSSPSNRFWLVAGMEGSRQAKRSHCASSPPAGFGRVADGSFKSSGAEQRGGNLTSWLTKPRHPKVGWRSVGKFMYCKGSLLPCPGALEPLDTPGAGGRCHQPCASRPFGILPSPQQGLALHCTGAWASFVGGRQEILASAPGIPIRGELLAGPYGHCWHHW